MTYLLIIKNQIECNYTYRFLYGTSDEIEQKLIKFNDKFDLIFETETVKPIELINLIVTEIKSYIDLQCIYLYVHDDGTTEHTFEFNLNDTSLENEFLIRVKHLIDHL